MRNEHRKTWMSTGDAIVADSLPMHYVIIVAWVGSNFLGAGPIVNLIFAATTYAFWRLERMISKT